jgi:predicted transcriptional regulator
VRRQRRGGVYLFEASVQRDDIIGRELTALVDKMGGGSLQPLLTNLVRARGITADELRDLLKLVDELDARKKSKKPLG